MEIPIIIGFVAAVAHVLSGPDHLAAVTPLVFDTGKKHWKIGLSWGTGHLIGMLLIGVLFYFFKDYIPVESISSYSEQFVGIILIGIGLWSFYRIKNKKKSHKHPHFHRDNTFIHIHEHPHPHQGHEHEHAKTSKSQNYVTALSIGVIHGFAGIAHFVLLLPVLGFKEKSDALQYILGFALGIVFAMISYTALVGKLQVRNDNREKPIYKNFQFWSGVLAVVVGVYWVFVN